MLSIRACAKVNLTLEVLGKRDDGYHRVASVMQTIALCDTLHFAPSDRLRLRCNVASLETPDNLVLRAATALRKHTGCTLGADIRLEKAIPPAAGLGGGSSDAASTLIALNRLWGLGLEHEALHSLAAPLGSDVPFFLRSGTALTEGRGEEVHPLPSLPPAHFVLLVPPVEIPRKTATLYGHLTQEHYTGGDATRRLQRCLEGGRRPAGRLLFNAFEAVAFDLFPSLEEHRRVLLEAGAGWVRLTGTGPGLYTFTASKGEAFALAERLRRAGHRPYVAASAGPFEMQPSSS